MLFTRNKLKLKPAHDFTGPVFVKPQVAPSGGC